MAVPLLSIPVLLAYTLTKAQFMQPWCHLYASSDNSYGLSKGSPVTVSGITVGYVKDVRLVREGEVGVRFTVRRNYMRLIRKDTRARFRQKNIVVGDWTIELTGGSGTQPVVSDYDTLRSEPPMRLDGTIHQITSIVSRLESVISGISEGRGTVGRLLAEDTMVEIAHAIGRNVEDLVSAAGAAVLLTDTLLREFTSLGRTGNGILDSLGFIAGRVRLSLEDVSAILKNFRGASDDVAPMLDEVRDDIREAERMMSVLQKSWIYRRIAGEPEDPLLKGSP